MSFDFTVDRNSPKWVLGADGYLKEYIADASAIEFNADGSYKGVLVEPESVNEARASEDLDNATYWFEARTTIATDTETDPKGGTNSFLLSETIDNDTHAFVGNSTNNAQAVTSGETWTQSIFVKKGDGANAPDIVQLAYASGGFPTNYANFDISVGGGTSGTVTASTGGTGRIRYYGNGWYRISLTATADSSDANAARVFLHFTNNNPNATAAPSYAGQTDANVFIWGAQLEESPIATSYIPTTTGAVTRVKDDIYLTSASSLIGQTEGTLFVEVDWRRTPGISQELLYISNNDFTNRIFIRHTGFNLSAEGNGISINESASSYSGIQKVALAYATNNSALFRNGSQVGTTDTTCTISSGKTDIDFGQSYASTSQANMWIRAVALFTTRLSDAEVYSLTGYDTYAQMANALQYTIL